jgi:hypothetical protein
MPGSLFAQQEQTNYGERNADDSPPRRWFVEKQDASDRHDGGAAGQDRRNHGERTTFLEKKEKRDRAGADANAGKQRIIKTNTTEFLIPSSRTPEDQQVDQDRQCGAGFDNETAETFTNAIGSKTGKDLMRAVEYGSNDRIPKPSCHKQNLTYEMDHPREN